MTKMTWAALYERAVATCQPRDVSTSLYTGSVAAGIMTNQEHVYTGVSIDTACSLGYCAERNALGSMLTAGETVATRVVAVKGREILMPCGACREFLMQLGPASRDTEILVSLTPLKTVKLAELMPAYWQ